LVANEQAGVCLIIGKAVEEILAELKLLPSKWKYYGSSRKASLTAMSPFMVTT